jgi:aldose 1-epimerase
MTKTVTGGGLKRSDFQQEVDGKQTDLFILSNGAMEVAITNFGAKVVSLLVPDRQGKPIDVVLGHNNINEYLCSQEAYFGAVCGRVANRIAKGRFTLDGKTYQLAVNNGPNHLHGGLKGFNAVVWDALPANDHTLELTYHAADGEEGYPGDLRVKVIYTLAADALQISDTAETGSATILNLTNHSYFNLSGAGDPYVGDHLLTINADAYLPTDDTAIPYGKPAPVEGTPMDFRTPHTIGERINDDFEQLRFGRGYDHTYVLNRQASQPAATAMSPKTGITMEVSTDQPGVQLYTGNWMTGEFEGKNGHRYPSRAAFCLETQHFPDSINQPDYPSVVLRKGEIFQSKTLFKFYIS